MYFFVQVGERHDEEEDDGDSDDGLGFQLKSKPKTIDEILAHSDDDEMEVEQVRKPIFGLFHINGFRVLAIIFTVLR